jgi:hypothetical protein
LRRCALRSYERRVQPDATLNGRLAPSAPPVLTETVSPVMALVGVIWNVALPALKLGEAAAPAWSVADPSPE